MSEIRKLKVAAEPTYLNKEMVIGTLFAPGIGTLVGAAIGKSRMENEKEYGKKVSDQPSIWNKDLLLGAQLGGIGGAIAGMAVGLVMTGAAILATGPAGLAALTLVATAAKVGSMAGTLLGGFMGGKKGQSTERAQFEQSMHQDQQQAINQAMGKSLSQEPQRGKGREFAPAIEQERGLQAMAEQAR
jgi:hypothetical protein